MDVAVIFYLDRKGIFMLTMSECISVTKISSLVNLHNRTATLFIYLFILVRKRTTTILVHIKWRCIFADVINVSIKNEDACDIGTIQYALYAQLI